MGELLTRRWTKIDYKEPQQRYAKSRARFNVVWAGRRSGKTEIAKRRVILRALRFTRYPDGYFIMGAPTYKQAKDIFWGDLKSLVPPFLRAGDPHETSLTIHLVNGTRISCIGLDKPERHEGTPIDGGVLDEYANMKPEVWSKHLRPALDTPNRLGWLDFIGVPEGRNHFYDLSRAAQADTTGEWLTHHWKSTLILPDWQIAAARDDLDELTFAQEYEADFVSFQGRAYYAFNEDVHGGYQLQYQPDRDLVFCFDFNVSPGTATVVQEFDNVHGWPNVKKKFTGVIGEVYIPQNSNTRLVCNRLNKDWGHHKGPVFLHGDATGALPGSAKLDGGDWEIVMQVLKKGFGDRLFPSYPRSNPPERSRVNALNSRLMTVDGEIGLLIDRTKAPETIKDFEGVRLVEGGSGEIDKKHDLKLTHLTDGVGYYVHDHYPVDGGSSFQETEIF